MDSRGLRLVDIAGDILEPDLQRPIPLTRNPDPAKLTGGAVDDVLLVARPAARTHSPVHLRNRRPRRLIGDGPGDVEGVAGPPRVAAEDLHPLRRAGGVVVDVDGAGFGAGGIAGGVGGRDLKCVGSIGEKLGRTSVIGSWLIRTRNRVREVARPRPI